MKKIILLSAFLMFVPLFVNAIFLGFPSQSGEYLGRYYCGGVSYQSEKHTAYVHCLQREEARKQIQREEEERQAKEREKERIIKEEKERELEEQRIAKIVQAELEKERQGNIEKQEKIDRETQEKIDRETQERQEKIAELKEIIRQLQLKVIKLLEQRILLLSGSIIN